MDQDMWVDPAAGRGMVELSWDWTADNEVVRVGPPGCGKTHYVTQQMAAALKKHYKVWGVSLTVAAAEAMRDQIKRDGIKTKALQVGTLHKACFALLGLKQEQVAESEDAIKLWNEEQIVSRPSWVLPLPGKRWASNSEWDSAASRPETPGEALMAWLQRSRASLLPLADMDPRVRELHTAWMAFKEHNLVDGQPLFDFVDMLGAAWQNGETLPGDPDVVIADEAQDGTPLWWVTLRHLAKDAQVLAVVGDADQCLYQWTGAWPAAMLNPAITRDPGARRYGVLSQSYRVPKLVRDRAAAWISQVSEREPVEYLPRAGDEGEVFRLACRWAAPTGALVQSIEGDMAAGRSVMLLTSCGYMLSLIKLALREAGIPYGNKYRPTDGGLNPLNFQGNGAAIVDRLLTYRKLADRKEPWTVPELQLWTAMLKVKAFNDRSCRAAIEQLDEETPDANLFCEPDTWFPPAAVAAIEAGDVEWLQANALAEYERPMRYAAEILQKRGPRVLRDARNGRVDVNLGTIYSVKGGEADVVYLWPDLSPAGWREFDRPATRDAIYRLFYVGMTRARQRLVLCDPSSFRTVRWNTAGGR